MSAYIEIGKIVNTQGIRGDLRVIPTTDDPKRFELLKEIYIESRNELKKYTIEKVWYHKQFVILKLKEISSMTEGETLKNSIIKIPREFALPLEEDEYYIGDLYDIDVYTDHDEYLGKITDIIFTGSNDVYVVRKEGETKDLLIPAIKDCILNVDLDHKKMVVSLLEGLRD
ncbi:MAG: rRNA processing protein RimM [Epulopiscium sp.]|uniref:Ribosome maturation factor RimM n=1 Tax=Defluviitalea raffinosedens TaxID=1450156 RepID=A0A7C8HIC0_9FIRM|nr:ribosome maturation factor RimM [Defluviitalea raffinosedens]MBZ4669303.1 rimM [Defluviitaleaceae bacterium]MDK2788593.1 rRNA processing protein RimM [Candidatus Epulonipiscium sp.]KAE9637174.1 16S rRNA processing protein RimM [Defluviitalea raffinosedens]MBM7686522.1 16S rRNA processing protein RimM [Defluviitalea raffinosedens]HHW66799.1 16S rRNA processing protein RimM [Candidatus Epulonipiscium sp.]